MRSTELNLINTAATSVSSHRCTHHSGRARRNISDISADDPFFTHLPPQRSKSVGECWVFLRPTRGLRRRGGRSRTATDVDTAESNSSSPGDVDHSRMSLSLIRTNERLLSSVCPSVRLSAGRRRVLSTHFGMRAPCSQFHRPKHTAAAQCFNNERMNECNARRLSRQRTQARTENTYPAMCAWVSAKLGVCGSTGTTVNIPIIHFNCTNTLAAHRYNDTVTISQCMHSTDCPLVRYIILIVISGMVLKIYFGGTRPFQVHNCVTNEK